MENIRKRFQKKLFLITLICILVLNHNIPYALAYDSNTTNMITETTSTYKIMIEETEFGKVTSDKVYGKEGDTISLEIEAFEGYELESLEVKYWTSGNISTATGSAINLEEKVIAVSGAIIETNNEFATVTGSAIILPLDNNTFIMPASDVTVVASFIPIVIEHVWVNFDINHPSIKVLENPKSQIIDKKVDKVSVVDELVWENEKYEEYIFLGWSTKVEIETEDDLWDFDVDRISDHTKGDVLTLYAQWKNVDKYVEGTKENPVRIETEEELQYLSKKVSDGESYKNVYFQLVDDITLSEPWIPIGHKDTPFEGNFDGKQRSINNVNTDQNNEYAGLFGYILDAEISNLFVTGDIKAMKYAGGLVGYTAGNSKVTNSAMNGTVSAGEYVGGISGYTESYSYIEDSFFYGELKSNYNLSSIGAITGYGYESNRNVYYYIENIQTIQDDLYSIGLSKEQFSSGELAYRLNSSSGVEYKKIWGQGASYPIFAKDETEVIYKIELTDTIDGQISLYTKQYVRTSDKVNIDIKLNDGNILKLLRVTDSSSKKIFSASQKHIKDNKISFVMPSHNVFIDATIVEKTSDKSFILKLHSDGKITEVEVENGDIFQEIPEGKEEVNGIQYRFGGWYLDEALELEYDMNTAITQGIDLYAEWISSDSIHVKFIKNGEDVLTFPRDRMISRYHTITNIMEPSRKGDRYDGYEFITWSMDAEGLLVFHPERPIEEQVKLTDNNETLTLYAQWKAVDLLTLGTAERPYPIESKEDMDVLARRVNDGLGYVDGKGYGYLDSHFILMDSIRLDEWVGIGTLNNPFQGNFDGNGNSVILDITGKNNIGLFGHVVNGTIKNITTMGNVSGNNNVAALVGQSGDNVTIMNIKNKANITGTGTSIAGIVGQSGKILSFVILVTKVL